MKNLLKRSATRGFTLVELIIVIVIIGILAAIAVPQFTGVQTSARVAAYKASAAAYQSSVTAWYAANPYGTGTAAAPAYPNCAGLEAAVDTFVPADANLGVGDPNGNGCLITSTITEVTGYLGDNPAEQFTLQFPWGTN